MLNNFSQLYLRILKFKNFIERSELEMVKAHGLKRNDSLVLLAIDEREQSLGELCSICCIDKSTMTKIVKNLQVNAYVERKGGSRNFRLCLTGKGKALVESTYHAFEKLNNSASEFLTEEEMKSLYTLFDKLLSIPEEKYISEIKQRVKKSED